jgi:N-acetylmuramoyl-L-alanine amidase
MTFDKKGWLGGVNHQPTKNFSKAKNPKEIIVMHYTAGYKANSAINHFLNVNAPKKASAHFVVETNGQVTQMVSTDYCAWHAGGGYYHGRPQVNMFSIGIEIVNPGYHYRKPDGSYLNWAKKPVSSAALAPFPGMTEAVEPWAGSAKLSWPNFPEAQLDAVEDLTRSLLTAYSSLEDIVGHRDVDVVRKLKVDPGPAFPMRRFRLLLDDRADLLPQPSQPPAGGTGVAGPGRTYCVNLPNDTLNVRGGPGDAFETLSWGRSPTATRSSALRCRAVGTGSGVGSTERLAKDGFMRGI